MFTKLKKPFRHEHAHLEPDAAGGGQVVEGDPGLDSVPPGQTDVRDGIQVGGRSDLALELPAILATADTEKPPRPTASTRRLCGETVGHVGLVGPSAHEELSKVLVGGFHQRGGAAIGAGVDVGAGANRELHAGLASYVGG